ncbi:MAG: bifunctional 4-hydroxy-2-oxoglutarate aldolase/2-dehydro-3-deoxy-phosphogluconate aldolase [Cyanobium sp.]|jgi:2-keto-3-deoxy-6-phosphogluconate aldolase|nr:bifunctional 4-hydroxy-2-oxoglutarate aldolase/2-dehydro-3-deoxy-phosphogluconate aldolase [Cyanobium sp.]
MACADALLRSLRRQPLLVVLRPGEPLQAIPMLESLQSLGLIHVEIAWQPQVGWVAQMAELRGRFPDLELGAASVCEPQGVDEAASAGCRYAVSPVLDAELLQEALRRDLLLVPGVMTASEVHRARQLGCRIVKLFPAVSVGRDHWRRLRDPLGAPLPFCIAAGGLTPADVQPWLAAGVDAVALGSGLGSALGESAGWRELLAHLTSLAERQA